MPRATPVPDNEETSTAPKRVRRAPRKKALAAEDVVPVTDEMVVTAPAATPVPVRRKAPTRRVAAPAADVGRVSESYVATASASPRPRRGGRLQMAVVLGVLVIGVGASVAIGLSDSGKIDVAARIQEQSQLVANQNGGGEGGTTQTIPVQNTPVNVPNGGLIPAGAATPAPPPPPEPATTTASTTDDTTGTSTETVVEETSADTIPEEAGALAPETTAEPELAQ